MKQTQNQYQGYKRNRPASLPAGSSFIEVDTGDMYIYDLGGNPVKVNNPGGDGVPYTGATSDLDMGANGVISQSLQLSGGVGANGTMSWNSTEQTMDLQSGGITYQVGQEIAPLVRNNNGAPILNGTPVKFTGALGASGKITVEPAIADGTTISGYIMGVTTEDIANGEDGHVTWFGKVRGITTDGSNYGQVWNDGDVLYVSEVTAGWLTNVKPSAPNLQIFVGIVVNSHVTNGTLFIRPSWRSSLKDLDDVDGTPVTVSGQILVWDNDLDVFDFTENINNYDKPSLRSVAVTSTFSQPGETINCTSGTFSVLLPTAVGVQGVKYTLKNSGVGVITLDADGAETIDGSLTVTVNTTEFQTVQSDGSNWIIINN